ncbi:MAG: AMP-binding protein [Gammaproteobacteria bacterium]|nr:AMP-binding protein [Gammaproteobacteria bacterium]
MLHHRFIRSAKSNQSKTAISDCNLGRDLTYQQTLIGSLILARRFGKMERGRIGIMLPTSSAGALSIIGATMAGLAPVMINYSTGAEKNCLYAQRQCDFKTIITTKGLLEKTGCPMLPEMVLIEDIMGNLGKTEKALAFLRSKLPTSLLCWISGKNNPETSAVVLFTSGSEKDPKVVQLTHHNIESNIDAFSDMMRISEFDSMLSVLPYFHVFGLTVNLWTPLTHGMTSVDYANPLEFKTIARIIKNKQPEIVVGTPFFLEGYLRQSKPGGFDCLRLVVSGADKCPESLRAAYREKHGIEIIEGYGTTETSPVISANPREANKPGSIGRPIPGTRVRIINYDTGEECAAGETGKIIVKGEGVMHGYLNDTEETSLRLKGGWYDTGDLGYMDEDGYLWHQGRMKRFVKIGGEMVSLVNVEETLNDMTPQDIECCAVELPDSKRGSKIVAVTTGKIDQQETLKKLSKELPNLALPKKFLVVPEFPRMGSGKTDFRTLTKIVIEQEGHKDKE